MEKLMPWIIAVVMILVLVSTGAASAIIGNLGKALGSLGIVFGILIILAIVFAGFNKR